MSNSQGTNLAADENNDIPTTEEQLEAIGRGKFNYIVILVLASFNIAYGMEILVTNLCFRAMPRTEWGMTDQDRAHLVSVAYIGFIIGAMIAGFSADKVGRKPLIFLHATLFFPFALWSALATNLSSVYITRFVVGIAVGITLPVSVSLISELAPPSQRGWMILAVPSIGFFTGQILVLLVGIVAMEEDIECDDNCGWWRWVFAAGLVPDTIGFLLSFAFVPESPRFLLLHGRVAEAEAVVARIAAANGAEARLRAGGRVRPLDPPSVRASLWELIAPPLAGDMLIIAVVWTLLGFGLYGFNFLAPILLETVYHLNSYSQVSLLPPPPPADAKLLRVKSYLFRMLPSLGPGPNLA
jgi:MFS family permease